LGENKTGRKRKILLFLVTNLVSAACLYWTLRDAHLAELKDDLLTMNWWWVAVAVIADIAVYCWHGLRWSLLLQPIARATFGQAVGAVYVGLFTNEVLPFRVGELVRCYLMGRWNELPFSVMLSSALIERVFDGIWLSLCLLVTLWYVPFPESFHYVVTLGYFTAAIALGLALLMTAAVQFREKAHVMLRGGGWKKQVRVVIDDLQQIGRSRYLYFSFFQSLPYLLLSTLPIYASLLGYGFDLSLGVAFALMVILRLGSVVPQAPGNIGVYQFLTKEALVRIFNVVPDQAARFSLVLWGIVTIPLLLGGLLALLITEVKLTEVHRAARQEARAHRQI
jgi:glycosyltransferase 2 family protein